MIRFSSLRIREGLGAEDGRHLTGCESRPVQQAIGSGAQGDSQPERDIRQLGQVHFPPSGSHHGSLPRQEYSVSQLGRVPTGAVVVFSLHILYLFSSIEPLLISIEDVAAAKHCE